MKKPPRKSAAFDKDWAAASKRCEGYKFEALPQTHRDWLMATPDDKKRSVSVDPRTFKWVRVEKPRI